MRLLLAGLPILAVSVLHPVSAQDNVADETLGWSGVGEFGYVATSGNTDTQNLNTKLGLTNETRTWRHILGIEALNNTDADTTTAERYAAFGQADYKLNATDYLFGRLSYETDKFSGYEYKITEVVGYGRRVLDQNNMTLDLEGGPGLRQSKLDNGDSENEVIARIAAVYLWKFSETSRFSQELSSEIGEENAVTKSVTALHADVVGNLGIKLSLTVENTSEVPAGIDKNDVETAVSLVYAF